MNTSVPNPTVAILIATRNRPDDVRAALKSVFRQTRQPDQIVVLDDGSDEPLAEALSNLDQRAEITWVRNENPTGVSGARNRLTSESNCNILVYLDDDAVFLSDDAIEQTINVLLEYPETGIVAFRIETPDHPEIDFQLPFKRSVARKPGMLEQPNEVSYFVGAAHAIKRQVFERCGMYPEEFVYGHEELDLSYRALNNGFKIRYEPGVRVAHHTRPSVIVDRGRRSGELYFNVRNRLWLAYRNLPARYAVGYFAIWSGYYLIAALKIRKPITWLSALLAGLQGLPKQPRNPIGKQAVQYLKKNHGRLWM